MQAIVLAAGRGTRMWPLATRTPKPLLPIAGKPVLRWMLEALQHAGLDGAVVVVPKGDRALRAAVRSWGLPLPVSFAVQAQPRGTGDAVACAARRVNGDALVVVADALVAAPTLAALAKARGFVVAAADVADGSRYGVLATRGRKVVGLREKPVGARRAKVNTGLYRVPAEALLATLDLKPSRRGEHEFTDVVASWARAGKLSWLAAKGWLDVGAPWDLLDAQEAWLPPALDAALGKRRQGGGGSIESGVHVRGRLFADAGAIVKAGTYVEGDVWVGPGATIGPNAYLRGPLCVGAGAKVGANCEAKASVLLDGARVPHLSYVGDSVLGEGCNLGAGTQLANVRHDGAPVSVRTKAGRFATGRRKLGAIVGDGAKTGVNCSLNPGAVLAPGARLEPGSVHSGLIGHRPPGTS